MIILTYVLLKKYIAQVPFATAAASAVNYSFDTFEPLRILKTLSFYTLANFGLVLDKLHFDWGIGNFIGTGYLIPWVEYPRSAQILFVCSFVSISSSLIIWIIQKRNKLTGIVFLIVYLLVLLPPSLVPNYMQSRWAAPSFYTLITFIGIILHDTKLGNIQKKLRVFQIIQILFGLFILATSGLLIINSNFVQLFSTKWFLGIP